MTGTMDWAALGREIKARRGKLRIPQDMVDIGGPSEFTVRRLERAETDAIRPKTRKQLEVALQWRDGLVDRILDGTATEDELADIVDRKTYGPNERIPPVTHDRTGGAAAAPLGGVAASANGQTVSPASIPSRSQVGKPALTVDSTTGELVAELLRRLAAERTPTHAKTEAVAALSRLMPELYAGGE